MQSARDVSRNDNRIIIHFDYDCFYASVVENENPALKSVPLAIQQKQIIVTCNYEARRRGIRKMQLLSEVRKECPEVVIVLGEDLTRFRNASKDLYNFLKESIWSDRAERLGFDEVWLDCTDMVDFNVSLLNDNDLSHSFFCLDKNNPTIGFDFDGRRIYGPTYPPAKLLAKDIAVSNALTTQDTRLVLASHLARYLRHELESRRGYTATVGIASNRLLSKLVGNVNKPHNQTTFIPILMQESPYQSSVTTFMDSHEIGKVPWIGFKLAQKISARILGRTPTFDEWITYHAKEAVCVRDVRLFSGMGPEMLEEILSGPGSQKGIGGKVWGLINGVDDSEVGKVKRVPTQISQEDSYMKYLHTFEDVKKQLLLLAKRLIERMHIDLTEPDDTGDESSVSLRWLAHPRTIRLSTRPRPPLNADGTRSRTFQRISRSAPMPNFVFNMKEAVESIASRLVEETLVPMFRKLHSEKTGWNLSLVNIAVTNMAETAAETKDSEGRDIGRMFRLQDDFLKDFKVLDGESASQHPGLDRVAILGDCASLPDQGLETAASSLDGWLNEEEGFWCAICRTSMPLFAASAHERYHKMSDDGQVISEE